MHMCLLRNQLQAENRDFSLQMRTRPTMTLEDIEAIIREVKFTEDKLRKAREVAEDEKDIVLSPEFRDAPYIIAQAISMDLIHL